MSIATDLRGIAEELNNIAVHEVQISWEEFFKLSRRLADLAGELDELIVNHPRMMAGPGLVLVVDNSLPLFPRFSGYAKPPGPAADTWPSDTERA